MIEMSEWQSLKGSAISRKHAGDIDGAISELLKAIRLTREVPNLAQETENSLNYLADLYLLKNAITQAEETIRDTIELARSRQSFHLGCHLSILAEIQILKGEYREALASAEEARHQFQQKAHSHGVSTAEELIERIKSNLAAVSKESESH
jgi:tetratricopeptide (TPR) repeat protein